VPVGSVVVGSSKRFSSPKTFNYIAESGSSNGVYSKAQPESQPYLQGTVVTHAAGGSKLPRDRTS
jgi:hypothetical protein